jgi:hypothetical protein
MADDDVRIYALLEHGSHVATTGLAQATMALLPCLTFCWKLGVLVVLLFEVFSEVRSQGNLPRTSFVWSFGSVIPVSKSGNDKITDCSNPEYCHDYVTFQMNKDKVLGTTLTILVNVTGAANKKIDRVTFTGLSETKNDRLFCASIRDKCEQSEINRMGESTAPTGERAHACVCSVCVCCEIN